LPRRFKQQPIVFTFLKWPISDGSSTAARFTWRDTSYARRGAEYGDSKIPRRKETSAREEIHAERKI